MKSVMGLSQSACGRRVEQKSWSLARRVTVKYPWRIPDTQVVLEQLLPIKATLCRLSSWHMRLPGALLEFFQGYADWVYSVYQIVFIRCENRLKNIPEILSPKQESERSKSGVKQVNAPFFSYPLFFPSLCFSIFCLFFFFLSSRFTQARSCTLE